MIYTSTTTNELGKEFIKLNNVGSAAEGWTYIHDYAKEHCRDYGYCSYSIGEHYEDIGMASVLFFDEKAQCPLEVAGFDITEFGDENNPRYESFTSFNYEFDLTHILKKEPNLTATGIELPGRFSMDSFPDPREVQRCIRWLRTKNLVPTKTAAFDSSNIKVLVKQELKTYVSNGAAIAAVIHLGIPYKKIHGSAKVDVFLSKREIFGNRKKYGSSNKEQYLAY